MHANQTLAAIDIGSNTVHLIVAVTDGTQLTVLADDSIFVRLADGVWKLGYIPDERILATAQAIYHLRGIARSFGASRIVVAATEVARTARNTSALLGAVHSVTGLEPVVLSGMDEATLTFQGVTHGRQLPESVAVADLGGGSLEIILAELGRSTWRTSLALGSAFMHDRFTPSDPPRIEEIELLRHYLNEKLATIPNLRQVAALITSGGTVNALMRMVQQLEHRAAGDMVLRREDLRAALGVMLALPHEIVATEFHLRVARTRLLPTGALVLEALLEHLQLSGMLVSQAGIREGIILALARSGDDWLEGARQAASHPLASVAALLPAPEASTAARAPMGKVALTKVTTLAVAMTQYRKKALAGDVVAIHDMRVAARRLRTALETFAPCFPAMPYRRLLRLVKKMGQVLGAVRDNDVALAALRERLGTASPELWPGLRALMARHVAARRLGREALRNRLRANRVERIMRYVDALTMDDAYVMAPPTILHESALSIDEGGAR